MEIELRGQKMNLLSCKALYWKNEHTLMVSDAHFGKIAHFRSEGIAIPAMGIQNNFRRLDQILLTNNIDRIIFLGDLFHSKRNSEWDWFSTWRKKYSSIDMHIVLGNHDRIPLSCYAALPVTVHPEQLNIHPFTLTHFPADHFTPGQYIIAGHIHPVIRLRSRANQRFRFPCFYFSEQQAILPSFGYFTGGYAIQPFKGDAVIAVVNDELIDVSDVGG